MSLTSPAGTEFELKYRATSREAAERLLSSDTIGSFVATGTVRPTQHEDVYVDTDDASLDRAGYAVRLRRAGGRTIVSLKSRHKTGQGAFHAREEIEGPANGGLDPHGWPPSPARSLVLELAGDATLVEIVTVRQLRRRRNLVDGEVTVELSVDDVDVVARGRVVDRFTEVELELISGSPESLEPLADHLGSEDGLVPASGSKLETALTSAAAAVGETDPPGEPVMAEAPEEPAVPTSDPSAGAPLDPDADTAVTVDPTDVEAPAVTATAPRAPVTAPATAPGPAARQKSPGVSADDTLAEAGRKVLAFHFERMLAREPGTRSGEDPEELHGMRVATRRMRAAWRIFGDAFRPERTRRYRRRTRELAVRLGAVRDLDVLLTELDLYESEHPGDAAALAPLERAWRARREEARERLIDELDSERHAAFVEGFGDFVRIEGQWVAEIGATTPHRIRDTTPARIWAAHGDLRAYEAVLRWADVETLHRLRIAGKWLRYSLEFVREPLGPGVEPLVARIVAMQDHLGAMNDAHVAAGMARSLLVEHGARLSTDEGAAIGRYLVDREREAMRLSRAAGRPFRAVAGPAFRHALGRVVADL